MTSTGRFVEANHGTRFNSGGGEALFGFSLPFN